jgi:hypothetical protein
MAKFDEVDLKFIASVRKYLEAGHHQVRTTEIEEFAKKKLLPFEELADAILKDIKPANLLSERCISAIVVRADFYRLSRRPEFKQMSKKEAQRIVYRQRRGLAPIDYKPDMSKRRRRRP